MRGYTTLTRSKQSKIWRPWHRGNLLLDCCGLVPCSFSGIDSDHSFVMTAVEAHLMDDTTLDEDWMLWTVVAALGTLQQALAAVRIPVDFLH